MRGWNTYEDSNLEESGSRLGSVPDEVVGVWALLLGSCSSADLAYVLSTVRQTRVRIKLTKDKRSQPNQWDRLLQFASRYAEVCLKNYIAVSPQERSAAQQERLEVLEFISKSKQRDRGVLVNRVHTMIVQYFEMLWEQERPVVVKKKPVSAQEQPLVVQDKKEGEAYAVSAQENPLPVEEGLVENLKSRREVLPEQVVTYFENKCAEELDSAESSAKEIRILQRMECATELALHLIKVLGEDVALEYNATYIDNLMNCCLSDKETVRESTCAAVKDAVLVCLEELEVFYPVFSWGKRKGVVPTQYALVGGVLRPY
jgi:hypothetical protein